MGNYRYHLGVFRVRASKVAMVRIVRLHVALVIEVKVHLKRGGGENETWIVMKITNRDAEIDHSPA